METFVPADAASGGILVIEDDPDAARITADALETLGLPVEVAADGETGLKAWLARAPSLVLLDIMLPRGNGLHVLRELRKAERASGRPGTKVILLSAVYDRFAMVQDLFDGLDVRTFLPKPTPVSTLIEVARDALGHGEVPDPEEDPPAMLARSTPPAADAAPADPGPTAPDVIPAAPLGDDEAVALVLALADAARESGPGQAASSALWAALVDVPAVRVVRELQPYLELPCQGGARVAEWACSWRIPESLRGADILLAQAPRLGLAMRMFPAGLGFDAARLAWGLVLVRAITFPGRHHA